MARIGEQVGPYVLHEELGEGGNGTVWRASSPERGEVALKILKRAGPNSDRIQRFEREVQALSRLGHQSGVLPMLEYDLLSKPAPWLAMPIAVPIRKKLAGNASLEDVCRAVASLAAALGRIHAAGMAHRDIKPENAYFWNDQWCWGDFGLVDLPDALPLTADGDKLGPVHYLAPEMLQNGATADGKRGDVYSLGKVLWVLCTGQQYPMPGEQSPATPALTISAYSRHSRANQLDGLLYRMTRIDPVARPTTETVAHELTAWLSAPDTVAGLTALGEVLASLGGAAGAHLQRVDEVNRKKNTAAARVAELQEAVDQLAEQISSQTKLPLEADFEVPAYFKYRLGAGSGMMIWEHRHAVSFEIAATRGALRYRFKIACLGQLIANDTLHLATGFDLVRFVGGNASREMRRAPWYKHADIPLDSPLAYAAVVELGNGLREHAQEELSELLRSIGQSLTGG